MQICKCIFKNACIRAYLEIFYECIALLIINLDDSQFNQFSHMLFKEIPTDNLSHHCTSATGEEMLNILFRWDNFHFLLPSDLDFELSFPKSHSHRKAPVLPDHKFGPLQQDNYIGFHWNWQSRRSFAISWCHFYHPS